MIRTATIVFQLPDDSFAWGIQKSFSNILLDFAFMRAAIIQGAEKYLSSNFPGEDRYGQFHGETGQYRAQWAQRVMRLIEDFDTTLIVCLIIFGPPTTQNFFEFVMGRSSALASCIADLCITGDQEYSTCSRPINTLDSLVFSKESLQQIADDRANKRAISHGEAGGMLYFDKTKGCRVLLQKILAQMPQDRVDNINYKVLFLKNIFENTACVNQTDERVIQLVTHAYDPIESLQVRNQAVARSEFLSRNIF